MRRVPMQLGPRGIWPSLEALDLSAGQVLASV